MFGRKKDTEKPEERRPFDPRSRVSLYALGGLYLGYLLYQLVSPYLGGGGPAPSVPTLLLGVLVLGGGMTALFFLAWKMYRMPVPVDEEDGALLEEAGEDLPEDASPEEAEEEDSGDEEI